MQTIAAVECVHNLKSSAKLQYVQDQCYSCSEN